MAELLALVRLEAFADRRPDALSGGQRQRVALARSLAPRPELLLLDEPLSALDRGLREATRAELVRVQRQLGTTFVMVTHDQEEALSMATRIGLLEGGRLAQVGTPAEIYERPASRSVAAFMGAANILPARVRAPGLLDLPSLGAVARRTRRACPATCTWRSGRSACACPAVRPPGRTRWRARWPRAPTAASWSTTACGRRADAAGQPAARRRGGRALPPGEAVCVSWPPDACILLPRMNRWLVLGPVWAWLLLFIALPAAIVVALSFSQAAASVPPYDPLVTWDGWRPRCTCWATTTRPWWRTTSTWTPALQSLLVASVSSVLCLLIGYPMALAIARAPERWRSLLLLLVMLPFWTGFLLRIVAWIGLLGDDGWINAALLGPG